MGWKGGADSSTGPKGKCPSTLSQHDVLQDNAWMLAIEIVVLALALVGAGEGYRIVIFRLLRVKIHLGWVERGLAGLYTALGALYVLASIPAPLFLPALIAAVIIGGWLALAWTDIVDIASAGFLQVASGLRIYIRQFRHRGIPAVVLALSSIFLLVFELYVIGGVTAPNTFDGSIQVDFVVILLARHTVPTTLAPFAPGIGVTYPQGSAVAIATAVSLLGWPTVMSPTYLTPLFITTVVPSSYALGARIYEGSPVQGRHFGLISAIVFASLATWPRFLIAGSYDFAFAFPLLLLLIGGAISLSRRPKISWRLMLPFAVGGGVLAAFSIVAIEFLLTFLLLLVLIRQHSSLGNLIAGVARTLSVGATAVLFVIRGVSGYVLWWNYPGHVMTPLGVGTSIPPTSPGVNRLGSLVGFIDPFLFRPIDVWLSPFPLLKAELAILLCVGLLMLVLSVYPRPANVLWILPQETSEILVAGILSGLLLLAAYILAPIELLSFLPTNFNELAICLFTFYILVATLPLLYASRTLYPHQGMVTEQIVETHDLRFEPLCSSNPGGRRRSTVPAATLCSILLLCAPIISGVAVSMTDGPLYLGSIAESLGNVTGGDYAALEWMSVHLPPCSGVLVAPGSAGQYLPAYSNARLIYPMLPVPTNLSYQRAVHDLSLGHLAPTTLADLQTLRVTEVFVTAQSNILWPPFNSTALSESSSFLLEYRSGDALVFELLQETRATSCYPIS